MDPTILEMQQKFYRITLHNRSVPNSTPVALIERENYDLACEDFASWEENISRQRERGISSDDLELSLTVVYL